MSCPRCQMPLANPDEAICPSCGYALRPSQSEAPTTSMPTDVPAAPPMYLAPGSPQMPSGAYPGYGAPPSGSLYGPDMPPPPPPYPPYPGYPPYPPYGVAAPSTIPLAPPAWAPAAAPMHRNNALVVLAIVLLIAVVAGGGGALYLVANGQHGPGVPVSSTSSPTATATPSYNVIFQDPLTSNVNGWTNNSYCHFGSDGYHVTDRICYAPAGTFTNFDMSVQTVQVSGVITEFYGVAFRRTSAGNLYGFQIDSNGKWRVVKAVNNRDSDLVPYVPNAAIHRGLHAKNVLEVRASGTHFDFYVNGTKVGQVDDSAYASGYCGFEVYQGIEVAYTNLTIAIPSS